MRKLAVNDDNDDNDKNKIESLQYQVEILQVDLSILNDKVQYLTDLIEKNINTSQSSSSSSSMPLIYKSKTISSTQETCTIYPKYPPSIPVPPPPPSLSSLDTNNDYGEIIMGFTYDNEVVVWKVSRNENHLTAIAIYHKTGHRFKENIKIPIPLGWTVCCEESYKNNKCPKTGWKIWK